MKTRFLLLTILCLTLNWQFSLAQWTSLGSGITASSRVLAGFYPVNENVIWGYTFNSGAFTPAFEFTRTTDGGQTWLPGTLNGVDSAFFTFGIWALDDQTAWIGTADELDPISGRIYKTTDGGATWTYQSTGFTGINETPAGVWFWNENEGFAWGATCNTTFNDQIAVYSTADGGEHWVKSTLPAQLPGEGLCLANFNGYFSVVGDHVWFGSNKNRVFHSADRGHTWQVSSTSLPNETNIGTICFRDSLHGISLGFNPLRIARSEDGGTTWTTVPVTVPANFRGFQIEYVPGTRGTWFMVSSFSDHMISYDDGLTWENHTSNLDAWSVEFLNPKTGFGGSYINSPADGGLYKWTGAPLGNRLFVNDDASGANTGYNWADAFTDLQSALAIAEAGDQIWVAEGTYKPAATGSPQTATFLIDKNLRLYGGFVGTETSLSQRGDPAEHPSVLSGDLNGDDVEDDFVQNRADNVLHVMTMTNVISNGTLLDGFTISGGHADADTQPDSHGGAINSGGNPIVRHCIFTQNFSIDRGGAAFFLNASAGTSRFEHCDFISNKGNAGGAVDLRFSNGSFEDCLFSGNIAKDEGVTAFQENGGAIATRNANLEMKNCSFTSNLANFASGAFLYFVDDAGDGNSLVVDSCSFDLNSCQQGGSAMGAIIFGKNVSIQLSNSSFNQNETEDSYATVQVYTDAENSSLDVNVDNCQFTGNITYGNAGMDIGAFGIGSTATFNISNSLFKDNTALYSGGAMDLFANTGATANFLIEGCRFEGNAANSRAGALWISNSSDQFQATVSRCEFLNNTSASGAAVASFQDEFIEHTLSENASVTFDNCLFAGNTSNYAVIALDSLPGVKFLNCTIAGNESGGIQLADQSALTLQNTILYNPGFTEYTAATSDVTATSHGGNLVLDSSLNAVLTAQDKPETEPDFMSSTYEPSATSPLVNGGVNDGVTAATDLAGVERIQQGIVDIGAYESPFVNSAKEVVVGEIGLAPNPASHFLKVELPEPVSGLLEASLFDAQGKLVRALTLDASQMVGLQGLAAGMYTLKVVAGERVFAGRFVKQ